MTRLLLLVLLAVAVVAAAAVRQAGATVDPNPRIRFAAPTASVVPNPRIGRGSLGAPNPRIRFGKPVVIAPNPRMLGVSDRAA